MFCISDLVLLLLLKVLLLSCAGCADTVVSLTANSSVTCPDDSVSYTCTVPGALLAWIIISPDGSDMLNRPILSTFLNQTFTVGEPVMYTAAVPEFSDGLLTSVLTTVTEVQALNGTTVICRFNLTEEDLAVITLATPPSIPLNTIAFPSCLGNLVTLQWDPPSDSGGAAVSYELTVSPTPLSGPPPSLTNTSIQLSLDYSTNYNVSITANNCAGSSEPTQYTIAPIVGCSLDFTSGIDVLVLPPAPVVGSMLAFSCRSDQIVTSTCGADGLWSPDPDSFFCPSIAHCTVPDPPSNGSIVNYESLNSTVAEGIVLTYQCDSGLVLIGTTGTIECGNDGRWSQDPLGIMCVDNTQDGLANDISIAISVVVSSLLSVIVGFLLGLLVMYLFTHKKSSPGEGQVNPAVVYDEVTPKQPIELKSNQAYGHIDVGANQAYHHMNL